jgi:hypothetical protein
MELTLQIAVLNILFIENNNGKLGDKYVAVIV